MIKSTILKSEYEAIYKLLDLVCPVPYDCGTLCGAVCCSSGEELLSTAQSDDSIASAYITSALSDSADADKDSDHAPRITGDPYSPDEAPEMGIYLLPGEEKLHSRTMTG